MKVVVFGAGNMGSALAAALCDQDIQVSVWNRTREKTSRLIDLGANVSSSAGNAVLENDCLIFSLSNNEAAQSILNDCSNDLHGKSVIQLTTGEPREARTMSTFVKQAGGKYLDGAIMGFPNHVGTTSNTVLYSGDEEILKAYRIMFDAIGAATYFGEDPGAASAFDIACLMPIVAMTAGLFQGIKVCEREGLDPVRYDQFLREWMPLILDDSLTKYRTDGFAQDLGKAECTIGLMSTITNIFSNYCDGNKIDPVVFSALHDLFESGVQQGLSAHDWVNIGNLKNTPSR